MDMAPEDIIRSEQETRGPPTVRGQMAEALRAVAIKFHHSLDHTIAFEDCYVPECYNARAALDRHRAEPEYVCCDDHSDCPCYQEGLEAQREREGGGTA